MTEFLPKAEIEKRKQALRRLWTDRSAKNLLVDFYYYTESIQRLGRPAERYDYNLEFIEANSRYPGCYVPVYFPYIGVTFMPEILGCQTCMASNGMPWALPLITDNPTDVYRIKVPEPEKTEVFQRIVAESDYARKVKKFRGPFRLHSLGGTLDTACQIWKAEELYLAMYDRPKEVEYFLELVTELIIKTVRAMLKHLPEPVTITWPMVWAPAEAGLGISEDQLAVCSPALYEKYGLKHLQTLAKEFGGLIVHSCGNFEHNLPHLKQVENLNGLNFSICQNGSFRQGTRIEEVGRYLPETVLLPDFTYQGQDRFASYADYVEYVIQTVSGRYRTILQLSPHLINQPELEKVMEVLSRHGLINSTILNCCNKSK